MAVLKRKKGLVVTTGQEDRFEDVEVMPAWKWMSGAAMNEV